MAGVQWEAILKAVKEVADAATDLTFQMTGMNKPLPAMPCGTIQIISGPVCRSQESETFVYDEDEDQLTYHGRNFGVITIRLSVYAQGTSLDTYPRTYLDELVGQLFLPSVLEIFDAAGIVPVDRPAVVDTTDIVGNEVRGRASVDVRFNVGTYAEEDIWHIETVEAEGILNTPEDEMTFSLENV